MDIKGGSPFKIPMDYSAIFKDRLLIITGVGRSGTTILGKLIGSMTPVYYLFEPAIMKYHAMDDQLLAILFEDYFLPIIQGRNLNPSVHDDSFWGHYYSQAEIRYAHRKLSKREDALKFVADIQPLFVIKSNEIEQFSEGAKVLHIVRDGRDVVNSSVAHGWYTDEYMKTAIQGIYFENDAPCFLDVEQMARWPQMNQATRCALVWRILTQSLEEYATWTDLYENLIRDARGYLVCLKTRWPNLAFTKQTEMHLSSIGKHKGGSYPDVTDQIDPSERILFDETRKEYGYL